MTQTLLFHSPSVFSLSSSCPNQMGVCHWRDSTGSWTRLPAVWACSKGASTAQHWAQRSRSFNLPPRSNRAVCPWLKRTCRRSGRRETVWGTLPQTCLNLVLKPQGQAKTRYYGVIDKKVENQKSLRGFYFKRGCGHFCTALISCLLLPFAQSYNLFYLLTFPPKAKNLSCLQLFIPHLPTVKFLSPYFLINNIRSLISLWIIIQLFWIASVPRQV